MNPLASHDSIPLLEVAPSSSRQKLRRTMGREIVVLKISAVMLSVPLIRSATTEGTGFCGWMSCVLLFLHDFPAPIEDIALTLLSSAHEKECDGPEQHK